MNDLNLNKAEALLALKLTAEQESTSAFATPTDEELAMLLDDQVDATRRAQIMESIANDSAVFGRWMALVETADTLQIAAFEAAAESKAPGFFAQMVDSITANLRSWATAGGSFAAAAAVFLMVTGDPQYQHQLDDLYSEHNGAWDVLPAPKMDTRGTSRPLAKPLSVSELAVKSGVLKGLDALGPEFHLQNMAVTDEAITLHSDHDYLLDALGQFAVLSYFKCSLEVEGEYYQKASIVLDAFVDELSEYKDAFSQEFANRAGVSQDAQERVCRFSQSVVAKVNR